MSRGVAPHAVRRRMNKETQMMLVPQGSIEAYIRAANEYPMLTAEEEKSLAERLYYDGDIEAAKKLVLSHLRFVIHVARGYSGYGLPQAVFALCLLRCIGSKLKSMNMSFATGVL